MAGPQAQRRRDGEDVTAAQPTVQQPSPFLQQQRGPDLGIGASFQGADQALASQKRSMLDIELSGPISRADTQFHRRRMNSESARAEQGGNDEMAERWRIQAANMRVADNKMGEADEARARGDTRRAQELETDARQYYNRALRQEVLTEHQMAGRERFGDEPPPREILRAERQTWYRGDSNSIKYQQSLDQAGDDYIRLRPAFESDDPRARSAKEALMEHITDLGSNAQYGVAYERATAQHYREPVTEVQNFTEMIFGAGKLAEQLAKMDGIGKDLKKMLEDMDEELGKLKKKLEEGKATKEDVEKAKEISEFVNDSGIILEGLDTKSRPAAAAMLARGAAALLKGKRSEAFAQRQLAKEYLTEDPEYRKKLEELSEKLAKGQMTAGEAIKEMRTFREKLTTDFEKKPITEKSAAAFAGRLEAFIKTRKLDRELEEGKPAYKKELEDVRAIYKKGIDLAKKAEEARKAGRTKEAGEYEAQARALMKEADTKLAVLEYAQKLRESKAPKEMVEAVRSAFQMIGTENDWRARLAIKAAGLFLNNSRFFKSTAGKSVLGALSGFMSWLTDPKNKIDQEEANQKYSSLDIKSKSTMSLGPDIEAAAKKIKDGPEGLVKSLRGAKSFVGTDQQWRTEFVLKAVQFYLNNRGKFKGANGEAMLKRLLAFVSMVADPEQKMSADQQKESETYLEKLKKDLEKPAPKEAEKPQEAKPGQAKPVQEKLVKFAGLVKLRRERAGAAPTVTPPVAVRGVKSADDQARMDKLKERNVPEEVIKAVDAAYSDPDPVRRKAIIEAAELYLKYPKLFDAEALTEAKTALFDFIKSLSASIKEGTLTEEGAGIVKERLGKFTQFIEAAKEEDRKNKVMILDTSMAQLGAELERATDPAYKDALQKAIDQSKALRDKLNDPKTADQVTEQETKALSASLSRIAACKELLDTIQDKKVRGVVEKIVGRSLAAGNAEKSEEAEFQFFLARQYVDADASYRKILASSSEKLEKDPASLGAVKGEIGAFVAGLVEKEAAHIKDKDQRQKFIDYAKSVRDAGQGITIDDITRGYFALKIAKEYTEIEKLAGRKPKVREGALAIAQRGLDSMGAKDDPFIIAQQLEYSRSYLEAGQKGRDEYEKLSLRLQDLGIGLKNGTLTLESPDVKKVLAYSAAYKDAELKASLLTREMGKVTRNRSMERGLYERAIAKLEEYKGKLANGEEITPDYEKAVAMYLGFFSFKPSEVLAQYYYSRGIDPREKADEITRLEGLSKPSYNMSKLGSSLDRGNLSVIYGYAMDALDKGDFKTYEVYMKYAQGASSSDKRTREIAVSDANYFNMGSVSADDAAWKSGALLDKVNMERNIASRKDREKLDSYFYTVMNAFEKGDRNGAAAGRDMLGLYTDAVLGDKKLGKDALAHVEKYLGKDGLLNKAIKEGRTLAEQLALERGLEKPTTDQAVSILAGVQEDTAKMSITLSKDRFDKEAETLRGQNEREQRRKGATYRKENERLMGEARRARKKNDEQKAAGLESAAALSDYSAFTKALDEAKELSRKGHDLLIQAQALRKTAMEDPGKREELEKQAVELENQGKFLMQQSGDMLEGLKQFDRSMTKIWYGRGANFQSTKAESGRSELWAGITGISEISRQFLTDPSSVKTDEMGKKYQLAQRNLQTGYQMVENQFSLQKEAWQKLEMAEKLAKNNKEFSDKGAGQIVWEGEGGFKHTYYETWDYYVQVKYYGKEEDGIWIPMKEGEPGGTYREETEVRRGGATMQEVFTQADSPYKRENRVIHSGADNAWDLDKAKGRIYAGDLRGADRKLRQVSGRLTWTAAAMQVRNFKDQVSTSNDYSRKYKYYEYWFAKGDVYDKPTGYVGRLDSAWDDINKGYFDRAEGKIKAVENDSFVGMARQDMFNRASSLRDTADSLDGFISSLKNFNPLGTKSSDLKGGTKEDYDEVVDWVKTHKVTVTDTTTGQNVEINPLDAMKEDVRKQQANLRAKADLMEGELMKIKTADEVRLGMILVKTNDRETLANTENVKEYTQKWMDEAKIPAHLRPKGTFAITEQTYKQWMDELKKPEGERNLGQGLIAISEGTAAYIHAASYNESAAADLDKHKMGWDLSIKSYTEGVMNTLSGAPMARSVKFRHYKDSAKNAYTAFLQMGDGFALNPGDAEYGVTKALFVPAISGKFADVEFTRDADEGLSVPLTLRYAYLGHFKDLLKLSGENALGYTGQWLQDPMSEHGGKYLETVAMAAWGFGVNPNTGRYEKLKLNEKEQEVMNRYIEDFIAMKQEVFGDALKMHEYWISDKTGDYFKKKVEGMISYSKGLDALVASPYLRQDKGYVRELYKLRRQAWDEWKAEKDPDRKARRRKDYERLDLQVDKIVSTVDWAKGQRTWAADRARTFDIMQDAAHKEQWAGPIKVVVYGAAIYFTGGLGAIAIGGMSTMEATISYSDQIQWAGGEHNLTFKEKAMGYGGIALGVLSTVAPMLGEVGLMARAPRLAAGMNYTLIGGGIVMAIPQVYDMWKMYKKGEMTGIGFAANVLTAAQPALQIGVHGLHPKPFANRYLRFASGILLGTPASDHIPDLVRNEMYAVEYKKMAEYSPANADNLAQVHTKVGGLSVDESVTVMKLFEGKTIDINYAADLVNNYRKSIRHDQAKTIGQQKIKTFDEYTRDYARANPPPDIKVRAPGAERVGAVIKGEVKAEETPVRPGEPEGLKIEVDLSKGSSELETKLSKRKQELIDNEQWGKDEIELLERVSRELEYYKNVPDSQVPEHYKQWVKEPGSPVELAERFINNNGAFDGGAGPTGVIGKPFAFGKFMTEGDFTALHPPETVLPDGTVVVTKPDGTQVKVYHNKQHTENVAQTAHDLALKMPFTKADEAIFGAEAAGGKQNKADFLMQVGILHDADPMRTSGKPARAAATIEWMDSPDGVKLMKEKFGWDPDTADGKRKIDMAKAIIQRTEFPFDNAKVGEKTSLGFPRGEIPVYERDTTLLAGAPQRISERYKETSPQGHYEKMLSEMDADARAFVLREAPILSEYADKSSWYFGKPRAAYDSVIGLGTESGMNMMGGTSGFLKSLGQGGSFKQDVEIAKKYGIDLEIPAMDKVLELLGPDAKTNWDATRKIFDKIAMDGAEAKKQAEALVLEVVKDQPVKLDEDSVKKITARAVELSADRQRMSLDGEEYPATNRRMALAMDDPAGFALAEHLLDTALRKANIDPKEVRGDPAYAEAISRIMGEEGAMKDFTAKLNAAELPKAIERGKLDAELADAGVAGPVSSDARLILKALRGGDLERSERNRMLNLPTDLGAKIKPEMTHQDIIDLAHDLHRREVQDGALKVASELAKTRKLDEPARIAAEEKTKTYVEAYDQISRGVSEQDVMTKLGITKAEYDYLKMQVGLDVAELAGNFALLAIRPDMLQVHQTGENIGTLSRLAVSGNPDTYTQAVITSLEGIYGGRSKIPPELIPEKGTTLHDTVKNSAPALKKILEGIRRDIGFEENIYEGFLKLDSQVKKGQDAVDALGQNQRVNKEPQEIGVIVLDGAKTWMKNGLGYGGEGWQVHDRAYNGFEVGDLGLIIYMEAAKRFARENPEIYTKLQTAEGDEVIAVIPKEKLGVDAQKAIAEYEQKFRQTLETVALEMGISKESPLFSALADVNAHGGVVGVKTDAGGARKFSYEGKEYGDLNGALVGLEVGHSLDSLAKREGGKEAAKRIDGFINGVLGTKPDASLKQLRIERQAAAESGKELNVDAYATFRIGLESGMRADVQRLAENNGKGVTHVENGLAGPSVVNQMGHPVTDNLSRHFQDALTKSFEKYGIADKVEIYADGPMTFAFRFKEKVDMETFNKAVSEAGDIFPKLMKDRGVDKITKATVASTAVEAPDSITGTVREVRNGVVTVREMTIAEKRVQAEKKAKDRMKAPIIGEMFQYKATARGADQRLAALISDAHLFYKVENGKVVPAYSEASVLREAFTDGTGKLLIDESVIAALEKVASKKWIRTPEDLINHLRESKVTEENIEAFFKVLGFERIGETAKSEMGGMKPGAVFRRGEAEAGEVVLEAVVGGETVVPAPAKPAAPIGAEAIKAYKLNTPDGLAEFARKVALGDKDAVAALENLPSAAKKVVGEMAGDPAFARIAKSDYLFKSYIEDATGHGRKLLTEYSESIGKLVTEAVSGEVVKVPQEAKPVAVEPKVVVTDQGPVPDKVREAILNTKNPKLAEAYESFTKLSVADQEGIIGSLREQAKAKAEEAKRLQAENKPMLADEATEQAAKLEKRAVFLTELSALSGETGKAMETAYGFKSGELAQIYREGHTLDFARQKIAEKLGITADVNDGFIFGMLLNGNLAGLIKEIHPNASKIEMSVVGKGATGAYLVKVTDADGTVHSEFVKKVDMRPDAAGAENLRLSGVPAPEVITTTKSGIPLSYVQPDGQISPYGITRGIGDFNGTLKLAGKEISLTTDSAVSLYDMMSSPALMDIFINHPKEFWKQLGYMNAAGYAVGSVDAHPGNVYGMVMTLKDPRPADITALKDAGYHVWEADGKTKIFMLGRIDTDDSGGTYRASGEKGNFDFSSYRKWMSEESILPKVMTHLAKVRNEYEASTARWRFELPADKLQTANDKLWPVKQAQDGSYYLETGDRRKIAEFEREGFKLLYAPAADPQFITVEQLIKQGFGSGGGFLEGVKGWAKQHIGNQEYENAIRNGFYSRQGQPAGVSALPLGREEQMRMVDHGVGYHDYPSNGEANAPAFFSDNRTILMADYETVSLSKLGPDASKNFPEGKTVFVVPVSEKRAGELGGNAFKSGEKWLAVFPDEASIPADLTGKGMGVTQHRDVLRAPPGFGELTGIESKKLGAVHAFDYIMGMKERGFLKEFMKMEETLIDWERNQVKLIREDPAMNAPFIWQRIPADFADRYFAAVDRGTAPPVKPYVKPGEAVKPANVEAPTARAPSVEPKPVEPAVTNADQPTARAPVVEPGPGVVAEAVILESRREKWNNEGRFKNDFDFLVYRPVREVDSVVREPRFGNNEAALKEKVLERGAREKLDAQSADSMLGGEITDIINVMLNGEIAGGDVGKLKSGDFAGGSGRYFAILEAGAAKRYGEEGGKIYEGSHIAYVVPDETSRQVIAKALSKAVEKGLIGKDEAAAALSKVVTYEEFIGAPDGTYASSEFAKGRKTQSEEMLETAKRMDGLVSPVKDIGAVLAKSDTTVIEQTAINEHFGKREADAISLANAVKLQGDSFYQALATARVEETRIGKARVVEGYYNIQDGSIISFGPKENVPGDLAKNARKFEVEVSNLTGSITMRGAGDNPFLTSLDGMGLRLPPEGVSPKVWKDYRGTILSATRKIEETLPAGPGRDQALAALADFDMRERGRAAGASKPLQSAALGDSAIALDYLVSRALADPEKTGAWFKFMTENENVTRYALIAKRGLSIEYSKIKIEEFPYSEEGNKVKLELSDLAISLTGKNRSPKFSEIMEKIPEQWFTDAGLSKSDLIKRFDEGDKAAAIKEINGVTGKYGIVIIEHAILNTREYIAAEVTHVLRLEGQEDVKAYVIGESYGKDVVTKGGAHYSKMTGDVLIDYKALKNYGTPGVASHEIQHLFDNAAGFPKLGRNEGYWYDFDATVKVENTSVARQVIETLMSKGTKDALDSFGKLKWPDEYKKAYENAEAAMAIDENGRADPKWREREPDVLAKRIERYIDKLYQENIGLSFSDLYGKNVFGVVSGEVVAGPKGGGGKGGGGVEEPKVIVTQEAPEGVSPKIWKDYQDQLQSAKSKIIEKIPEGPARTEALDAIKAFDARERAKAEGASKPLRSEALGNSATALEYLVSKALADPEKAGAWFKFMTENESATRYALIAKLEIQITSDNITIEKFNSSKDDIGERKSIRKALAKKETTFEMIANALPDKWFTQAGYKRDELIEAYRNGDYDSVDKLGKVTLSHGIVISGKYGPVMAAEYAYTAALRGQPDLTGYVITETYGKGDVLNGDTAVFSAFTKKIFLTGAEHLGRGMPETIDIVKESAVHEFQHLFDDAAGYVIGISKTTVGQGMKAMPEFKANVETTAVAREVIEVIEKKGSAGAEKQIDRNMGRKVPHEYKTAYTRVKEALMTGEDGKPDPQWNTRSKEILKARLEKLIDSKYVEFTGLKFSDLFGPNVGLESVKVGGKPVQEVKPVTEEDIGTKSMALREARAELDRIREKSPQDSDAIGKAQAKYDGILKELGAMMPNESMAEVERRALGLEKKFTKQQDAAARELAGAVQLSDLAERVINKDKDALETMALLSDHPVRKIVEDLAADKRFRDALARKDGSDIDIAGNYSKQVEKVFLEMKAREARAQEPVSGNEPASSEPFAKAAQGDAEARKNLVDKYAKMSEPKSDIDALVLGEIDRRVAAGKQRKDAAAEVVDELLSESAKVSYHLGLDQTVLERKGAIATWTVEIAINRADQNGRLVPNAEDVIYAAALKKALGYALEGDAVVKLLGAKGAADLRDIYSGKVHAETIPDEAKLIFTGIERIAEMPREKLPQAIDAYMKALAEAKSKFGKLENADNFAYAFDHGITHLIENAPPDKLPDLLAKYAETTSKLTEKIKLGQYHSSTEEEASARMFEIAAILHMNGVKDPMAILANGKSGIVDLFLSSPESFRDFPLMADEIIGLISKMPDGAKFKVQKKGKDAKVETVEVSRGQIIETTLPWLFGDMSKISDPGNRERYFNIFKSNFEWHSPDAYRLAEKLAKDPNALLELASGLARGESDAKEKLRILGDHPAAVIVKTAADSISLQTREFTTTGEMPTKAVIDSLSFDAKPYSKQIKETMHPDTFQDQYGKLLADSVKTGKPMEKNELPILLYTIKDPQGIFQTDALAGALENDFFKKKMENKAVFDSVAGLLVDISLATKENSRGARAWLSMVEDNLMYLLVEETSSAKKPPALFKELLKSESDPQRKKTLEDRLEDYIQKRKTEKLKDAREDFASSKVRHLRNIWSSRNVLGQRGLMEMAEGMRGKVTKTEFTAELGNRYVELYSKDAKFSEDQKKDITKFALENSELFLQIYAYRKNVARFLDPANIPKDYKGKPESFALALEVLDKALLAQARGEFAQFKFSEEFRNELIKKYGKGKGAAIFDQWSTEVPVLVENQKYQIYETGKFEDGFNCGMVKGATACQNPANPLFFASSVVGSMELPWIKQVVVKVPGEPEALYRRWLMLVHGDNGKPVLLVQQEYYHAETFTEGAEIDKQVISALRKRYEPLGIEVRPVKANNKEDRNQKNYGYGTFESGRSPFFYIDSNMYSMGHEDAAWHGHHERTPGTSVDFGKGWAKKHLIKTEVP